MLSASVPPSGEGGNNTLYISGLKELKVGSDWKEGSMIPFPFQPCHRSYLPIPWSSSARCAPHLQREQWLWPHPGLRLQRCPCPGVLPHPGTKSMNRSQHRLKPTVSQNELVFLPLIQYFATVTGNITNIQGLEKLSGTPHLPS